NQSNKHTNIQTNIYTHTTNYNIRMTSRIVSRVAKGIDTSDGDGVNLKRVIGGPVERVDPFIMMDEIESDDSNDYMAGFPDHPHRGFETVTYVLAGSMEHRDHKGNHGILVPGSVQWMTAGRGIIHSEMPKMEEGLMHGFQIWVNLPAKDKMVEPRYQDISPDKVPIVEDSNGNKIKVLAGCYKKVTGPVEGVVTSPLLLDVEIAPGATFIEEIPVGHSSFAYVFEGSGKFGPADNQKEVNKSHIALLDGSNGQTQIEVTSEKGCRFLLAAGKPINEPIAQRGPFVMNTKEEIYQAISDYQNGLF
ncbi:hypothetical protein SAMD00019534_064180, partial [Acytostelium subglobosum LB1]|uniref:hypothetical protein n=1 Tax=Acytostelium subglobosum LB1 TaxID=1410327 RepID=UPI000644CD74